MISVAGLGATVTFIISDCSISTSPPEVTAIDSPSLAEKSIGVTVKL